MPRVTIILSIGLLFAVGSLTWILGPREAKEVSPEPNVASERGTRASPRSSSSENPWRALTRDTLPVYDRLEIARSISPSLKDEDIAALFEALAHTPRSGGEDDWYLVINEIMEQMRRHGVGSDRYADALGAIVVDSSRPEVVRDYAVQHLSLWIAPVDTERFPHEPVEENVRSSLDRIASVIRDQSLVATSIPGTALLALTDITPRLPAAAETWEQLSTYLDGAISGNMDVPASTRISAIQAVARTSQPAYLPVIRSLATNDSGDPSVRLSSIASLGLYGSGDDRPFLESLAASGDRFSYAARSALKRLPTE